MFIFKRSKHLLWKTECFVSLYLVLVLNKYSVACFRKTFVDCCKIPRTSNMVGCCDIKYGNKELPTKAYWCKQFYHDCRYQVLAVATDAKTKEESQNIKSGKRVTVRFSTFKPMYHQLWYRLTRWSIKNTTQYPVFQKTLRF